MRLRVFFDLSTDIAEEKNLNEKHPEKVKEMLELARTRLAEIEANHLTLGGDPQKYPKAKEPKWLGAN